MPKCVFNQAFQKRYRAESKRYRAESKIFPGPGRTRAYVRGRYGGMVRTLGRYQYGEANMIFDKSFEKHERLKFFIPPLLITTISYS